MVPVAALAISKARHAERVRRPDLEKPLDLGRRDDEVLVVPSATPPGQGGDGHFIEQPQVYWISRFQARGDALHEVPSARLARSGDLHV